MTTRQETVAISIRFPRQLVDDLTEIAATNRRSLNSEVVFRLERFAQERKSRGVAVGQCYACGHPIHSDMPVHRGGAYCTVEGCVACGPDR